ncbi:MAG: 4-(cytidine 5'-diphospho)-2-C-methyl-D-erythritol kinase [Bacteroidetes bacterium]|nr:4-(cytidine 5'-diphospho)-2-C-methyl-D-erythritol kinase [Bacteroidota bacterium]
MLVFPPVKVNLGLSIIEKRKDGYHSIESVFFPVPWTDALEVVITDHQNITFNSTGLPIPGDQANNLIIRAFNLLAKEHRLPGLNFHLHKILPMGAGLGGGSSNGAYALKLINEVCKLGISMKELEKMAAELGSDCPFFIESTPKFVSGRGEILEPIKINLQHWHMLIVMPPVAVGTADAYSRITPKVPETSIRQIISLPPEQWKDQLINDFEATVIQRYPVIGEIKKRMYEQGAAYASMSGSGAAVFGLFRSEPDLTGWKSNAHWSGVL